MVKTASGIGVGVGNVHEFCSFIKKRKMWKNQISNKKIQRIGGEKRINRQVEEGETR